MKPRYTVASSALAIRCLSIVAFSLAMLVCPVRAQDYPTRPVRIVVTLPPASTPDLGARIVADMLGKIWGQQVVVENKPGEAEQLVFNPFYLVHPTVTRCYRRSPRCSLSCRY